MIRKATSQDAKEVKHLIYIIWKDMELPIVVNNDKEVVLEVIEQSIVEGRHRNHYSNIHVYEIDNRVAGFINTCAGNEEMIMENNWKNIQFNRSFKLEGTPLPEKEADNSDLYIESVAVFPEFRGRGIASKLINYSIEYAKSENYPRITLNCENDNIGALKLYEKLGFEYLHDNILSGHPYQYMSIEFKENQ